MTVLHIGKKKRHRAILEFAIKLEQHSPLLSYPFYSPFQPPLWTHHDHSSEDFHVKDTQSPVLRIIFLVNLTIRKWNTEIEKRTRRTKKKGKKEDEGREEEKCN